MGKIWLETTDNRLIHLPIVGDDFNSPDDTVKIPTSVLTDRDRCFSDTIEVTTPSGTVTLDFTEDGRTGSCNQCGQCCSHPVADCPDPGGDCGWPLRTFRKFPDIHACQYLTITNNNKWGSAGNTECSIYTDLINTFKGCMYPPTQDKIKPHMTSCGFSWS